MAHLAQPAGAFDHVARFRVIEQAFLELIELVIVEVGGSVSLEGWQFNEDGFHVNRIIRKLRILKRSNDTTPFCYLNGD